MIILVIIGICDEYYKTLVYAMNIIKDLYKIKDCKMNLKKF
jgi:hypothetical protein